MDGNGAGYVSQQQHDEFAKLMAAKNEALEKEDSRQNERLKVLEADVRQISELVASVKELAVNMQNMAKLQEQQSHDIEELKNRDGQMWRTVVSHLATTIVGAVIMYVLTQIGL